MNSDQKLKIHDLSIDLAYAYATAYALNLDCAEEILEGAKALRRELPKEADGKRWGSRLFHEATQGFAVMRFH